MAGSDYVKGGSFLVEEAGKTPIFIPENLSMEQKELAKTVHDFVVDEVLPHEEDIEAQKPGLMIALLKKAAQLGILMAEMPAEYGGLGLGKVDSAAIAEGSTLQGSFNVSLMCHTGIATAPLVYYGNEPQKKKYIPRLASGEMLGAFALTEPDAGSDAMAIKTRAKYDPQKKVYILNGRKQFITNGGFADLITVFAQLEGKGITAFLVEKKFGGVTVEKEEKKMGIHGSSTVSMILENVPVPEENLLGSAGKGHHIAFNVLNVGRLKLGAATTGTSRHLINLTYNYVKERVQFGRPIISFQIIQQNFAMMIARLTLLESLTFRSVGMFDDIVNNKIGELGIEAVLREYAIEAAIAKVYGSETLYRIADEALQLHGGYGYCEEYGIERFYRDSRINLIYEGTNEINRLVITGTVLKLAAKGKIDVFSGMTNANERIKSLIQGAESKDAEGRIFAFVEVLKRLILFIGMQAAQKYGKSIGDEEYIMSGLSDMIIELYAVESAYIRGKELGKNGKNARSNAVYETTYFYVTDVAARVLDMGRRLVIHVMPDDEKAVRDYEKTMVGVLGFLRGDEQVLALKIVEEADRAAGYPF